MIYTQDFNYRPVNENRPLHIYLPDDYDYSNERYPVMYFFDGHNLFYDSEATYGKSWGLKDFMDHWDKKMIIVGMECAHYGDQRLIEYCPYDKWMFHHEIHGIGDQTMQWIINDVKPWVDNTFRTWGHREAAGIAGSSMGGIMSMHAALKYSDVFSKAACLSTGIFHNISSFRKVMNIYPMHSDMRIYMSWGQYEAGRAPHNLDPAYHTREARSTRKFERELQERGASTYIYYQPEGRHSEAYWEMQVPIFMHFLWY